MGRGNDLGKSLKVEYATGVWNSMKANVPGTEN